MNSSTCIDLCRGLLRTVLLLIFAYIPFSAFAQTSYVYHAPLRGWIPSNNKLYTSAAAAGAFQCAFHPSGSYVSYQIFEAGAPEHRDMSVKCALYDELGNFAYYFYDPVYYQVTCAIGHNWTGPDANGMCYAVPSNDPDPDKNLDFCPNAKGNPINSGTGTKYEIEVDYNGAGPFPLVQRRYYRSTVLPNSIPSAYEGGVYVYRQGQFGTFNWTEIPVPSRSSIQQKHPDKKFESSAPIF